MQNPEGRKSFKKREKQRWRKDTDLSKKKRREHRERNVMKGKACLSQERSYSKSRHSPRDRKCPTAVNV